MTFAFEPTLAFAEKLDSEDPLRPFRSQFHIPKTTGGTRCLYFVGNSTGLQPKKTQQYVQEELRIWAEMGSEGHFAGTPNWYAYHESVAEPLARLVGGLPIEVVAMNSLSANIQFMLAAFYQPSRERFKIAIEAGAFPSDRYAVVSHLQFRGYDPKTALVEVPPESLLSDLEKEKDRLALVLIGNPNYLSGRVFPSAELARFGKRHGIMVGLDLAHGIGNLDLRLHDWGIDFAVWCSYKYLNAGPGAIGGCFVHEKHARDFARPRLGGWWGHDKHTRFLMAPTFDPMAGAEGFQVSNPPIFQLAALRASLELFDEATLPALRKKSELLTAYLEYLVNSISGLPLELITPTDLAQRGAQLSWRVRGSAKRFVEGLKKQGVACDFREPDVLRVAPVPLYNQFVEVFRFAEILKNAKA